MLGNTHLAFRDWLGVMSKDFSKEADFKALDNLASTIAEEHKEHGFA